MRYLCLVGFSYAAATLCCAYWLPHGWLLPLSAALLALGLAGLLLRRRLWGRWLLRGTLCCLSAALALGVYALHWSSTVAPARAMDGVSAEAYIELREPPRHGVYNDTALADFVWNGQRFRVQCRLDDSGELQPGDLLSGTFKLSLPSDEAADRQEPGYLRACCVQLIASPVDSVSLQRPDRLPLRHWPAMLRLRITETCRTVFGSDTMPWFVALLTNQNEFLTFADKNDLKLAGLYHCMCTSGMHINVLLGLITVLCLQNRRLAACIGLPVCLFFWAVAGGTPSVSRAVVMQTLLLLAPLLQQEHDTSTAMALALLLTLIVQPDSIAHLGLQLSYLSVGGIALFAAPLYRWATTRKPVIILRRFPLIRPLVQTALSSLATALGALVLTAPLLARSFGVISPAAPLAGLPVLPLVTLCFSIGLPLMLLIALCPFLSILALPLNWLMRLVIALTRCFATLPVLYVSSPYWASWLVLAYGLLLLLWLGKSRPLVVCTGLAFSLCLAFGLQQWEFHRERNGFRLTALDVGQGQCLIAELDGQVCVVDCGGSYPEEAGEDCARWLLSHGYRRIDVLALTHFHADHAGGTAQLLTRMDTSLVLLPEVPDESGICDAIETTGAEIQWITSDRQLHLGSSQLTAYAPRSQKGDNEACLAFLLQYNDTKILVTGDMDRMTEIRLCKTADLPDLDILVAGHHGSRDASSATLLEHAQPETIIISCSDRYGHPHAEALDRFAAVGAVVLRTDVRGTITVER